MAFSFNRFSDAEKADTPQYTQAVVRQAQLENQAEMQANALRSQQMGGAAELYNAGMGDNTPIADFFGSMGNTPASAQNMDLGLQGYESGQGGLEAIDASQAMEGVDVLNEGGMLADLNAAADASELAGMADLAGAGDLASIADAGVATEAALGAGEIAGGMEAVLGAGEAAAAAQAATAAGAAGTAGAAGGGGLMAAMGPVGWAGLAGLALRNFL
jgi:hypothetical protein